MVVLPIRKRAGVEDVIKYNIIRGTMFCCYRSIKMKFKKHSLVYLLTGIFPYHIFKSGEISKFK